MNPFKFGMISSTDGHNTISTTEEDNFFGKFPSLSLGQRVLSMRWRTIMLWQNTKLVASGYAAVWAEDNTREALFDCDDAKEVYATTDPGFRFGFWWLELRSRCNQRP